METKFKVQANKIKCSPQHAFVHFFHGHFIEGFFEAYKEKGMIIFFMRDSTPSSKHFLKCMNANMNVKKLNTKKFIVYKLNKNTEGFDHVNWITPVLYFFDYEGILLQHVEKIKNAQELNNILQENSFKVTQKQFISTTIEMHLERDRQYILAMLYNNLDGQTHKLAKCFKNTLYNKITTNECPGVLLAKFLLPGGILRSHCFRRDETVDKLLNYVHHELLKGEKTKRLSLVLNFCADNKRLLQNINRELGDLIKEHETIINVEFKYLNPKKKVETKTLAQKFWHYLKCGSLNIIGFTLVSLGLYLLLSHETVTD